MTPTREELQKQLDAIQASLSAVTSQINKLDEPKLEVGRWYKVWRKNNPDSGGFLFSVNPSKFSNYGVWDNHWGSNYIIEYGNHEWTPATPSEVEEALIKEAERRGFKEGVRGKIPKGLIGFSVDEICRKGWNFKIKENKLFAAYAGHGGLPVFHNGQWAEIISSPVVKIGGVEAVYKGGIVSFAGIEYSKAELETLYSMMEDGRVMCFSTNWITRPLRNEDIIKILEGFEG
jgi:hypothetical protein